MYLDASYLAREESGPNAAKRKRSGELVVYFGEVVRRYIHVHKKSMTESFGPHTIYHLVAISCHSKSCRLGRSAHCRRMYFQKCSECYSLYPDLVLH